MKTFDIATAPEILTNFLANLGVLEPGKSILTVSKAGEGNMNVVLRLTSNSRSLILKQSRPFVQKYPQIPAPVNRIHTEALFYQTVDVAETRDYLPEVLAFDTENHVLVLQDLGNGDDLTAIYHSRSLAADVLNTLVRTLEGIHNTSVPADFPDNLELRKLNHQHIFILPFLEENGFDLDSIQPGLADLALPFKADEQLKNIITALGEKYLATGNTLLHGDYYPGSWLEVVGRIYVIDPEFCFVGFPEFDLGVMGAHLVMATHNPASLDMLLDLYRLPKDRQLVKQIAGTEILRRIIGLAQLPLDRSLSEKADLLQWAKNFVTYED